jgi:hypothetical protein
MSTTCGIRDPLKEGVSGTSKSKGGLSMTLGDVVSRLQKVRKTAKGYTALCPAHDDRHPSLLISESSGGNIRVHCFNLCSNDSILSAIGLEKKDLFVKESPSSVRFNANGTGAAPKTVKVIEAVYPYKDADGVTLYENIRYDPKGFTQRRPDNFGGYIYNLDGIDRVPYRLPELLETMEMPDPEVWLTEGEKDADNLGLLGLPASSFKNWTQSFNQYTRGSHAVLFRDHDTSGVKQANDAARIIAEAAKSVKLIDLYEGEPVADKHGQDVSDWIDARRGEGLDNETIAERLAVMVDGYDVWQPDAADAPKPANSSNSNGLQIEYLDTVTALEISWLARPLIPFGFFTLLDGIEGIGKTFAMLDLAKRLTLGLPMPFTGEKHDPGNVLFLSIEDSPEYILKPRFEKMLGDCSRLAILRGHLDFSAAGFADLEQTVEAHKMKFVLIDPIFSFTGRADINNTSDVRPITDRLNRIAAKYGIAIVGVRHINKSKGFGDSRNAGAHSVAWLQGCRSGLIAGHDAEDAESHNTN